MIAEPFICIKGPRAGELLWWDKDGFDGLPKRRSYMSPDGSGCEWMAYADFEREKLRELGFDGIVVKFEDQDCWIYLTTHNNTLLHGSPCRSYFAFSYSDRVLVHAEFLKAVCEKEGVEWLPQNHCWDCAGLSEGECLCLCHKPDPKKAYLVGIDPAKPGADRTVRQEIPIPPAIACTDPERCGEFCMGKCRRVRVEAE